LYSTNAVGFTKVTVPGRATDGTGGWLMIANQFDAPPNTIGSLMPQVPVGTELYKYNETAQAFDPAFTYSGGGVGWTYGGVADSRASLAPGEGGFIRNASQTPFTVVFLGQVLQGNLNNVVPGNMSMRGFMLPQGGTPDAMNFPLAGRAFTFYKFDRTMQNYQIYNYDSEFDGWDSVAPTFDIGESFLVLSGNPLTTWVKTFSIWP
jgi:hypothetical protein